MSPKSHRSLPRTAAAVALALASFAAALSCAASPAAAATAPFVCIDAGHGGSYSGAVGNGIYEKTINLAIAVELQKQLASMGYRTAMTRASDSKVTSRDIPTWHWLSDGAHLYTDGRSDLSDDLQARADVANHRGADLFVSIHNNDADSSGANGTETWAATFDPLGQRLSQLVQAQMIVDLGTANRGSKTTNFYVLRWSNMPAVLIEGGFVSSPLDAGRLRDPVFRWRLARAVARGIARFLGENPFKAIYPRVSGADRYATAAKLSAQGWPQGSRTVVLASGANWPDSLAAAPLSRKLDAPLLLTAPAALTPVARAEIVRLRPGRVVVLGSEGAVAATVASDALAAALAASSTATVERIGGADRYGTAALIAAAVGVPADGRIAVVSGRAFPDAVSLAPYAGRARMPILLADGGSLPAAERSFLASRAAQVKAVVVAGGENAVPARALTGLPKVTRLAGPDRYATNAKVLAAWGSGTIRPLVASGVDFPDALVAGAYGAKSGQPLMLAQPRILPDRIREFVGLSAKRIGGFTMVGGKLPYLMDAELRKALQLQ